MCVCTYVCVCVRTYVCVYVRTYVCGEIAKRVDKSKYPGIILDNKLRFDNNVLNIKIHLHNILFPKSEEHWY